LGDVRDAVLPISECSGEMGSQRVAWQEKFKGQRQKFKSLEDKRRKTKDKRQKIKVINGEL